MAKNEIYVGDVGTQLRFDIGVDNSNITKAVIKVRRPDKSCAEWNASLGPEDTEISYTIQSGDLDIKGKYMLQPYVELPGWSGYGKPVELNALQPVC
jgi:hypothetical protein